MESRNIYLSVSLKIINCRHRHDLSRVSIMFYMNSEKIKKSFYWPKELVDRWQSFLTNDNDGSASSSGAAFVFMLLPADMREEAKHLAKRDDIASAINEFIESLNRPRQEIPFERVRDAVNRTAKQQASRRRKPVKPEQSAG